MFEFFIKTIWFESNLISKNQLGLRPGDSWINQLPITHEIYWSFDDSFKVRTVFLDISKAFDKVWHKGLIFKLKQNGILDNWFVQTIDVYINHNNCIGHMLMACFIKYIYKVCCNEMK